jgi:type IV pilus assembly protein PilB
VLRPPCPTPASGDLVSATTSRDDYASTSDTRLGALLVDDGLLSHDAVGQLLERVSAGEGSLISLISAERSLSEGQLAMAAAKLNGLDYVDLSDYNVDAAAARLITSGLARRYMVIPIGWENGYLRVAMADATNVVAIDDLGSMTGAVIRPVVATRAGVDDAINRCYRVDSAAADLSAEAADHFNADVELSGVREVVEDSPIVKLVNLVITQAITDRASDIHLEPYEHDMRIRYRIDGVLHEMMRPPKNIQAGIISRLKVMADLNIAERRVPQDGRIMTTIDGKSVDLRVATLPTVYGEKIVLRVLDKSTALFRLEDLGFLDDNLRRYEASFRKPYGTILVTGPTGSGKSTTLYATLNILNDVSRNVITVEDPVEYQLQGINQVQVNNKAGLTFAAALRSILRSDPDVLLVGEIRDRETAIIAIEAALTGHLVLSTLHTNDAASTPGRLIEMGVEPYLVGTAIDCIVAQRLARRLCERCRAPYVPNPAELTAIGWDFEALGGTELPTLFKAAGCGACGRTGFRGRFAIHEVMQVTEEIESIIVERRHNDELRKSALAQGMLPFRDSAFREVYAGTTALEEVLRVIS